MTVELIGYVAIALGIAGFFCNPKVIVYLFLASTLLGAAGALTLDFLGGTNVQPAHLLLGFLTAKLLSDPRMRRAALDGIEIGRPGFWLLLTTLYGSISAFLLPRFFAGETLVVPVRAEGFNVLLGPSTSNITQPVYFVGDFVCFLMLYGFASAASNWKTLIRAALIVVILNLVFVMLDLTTYWTGTGELLSFIRNASYALLSDTEVQGFKRIVGSFTEASSFGYSSLGYFTFATTLWLFGVSPALTFSLSALTFLALIFSTSTTAYVGLAAVLVLLYLQTLLRWFFRPRTTQMVAFLLGMPFLFGLIAICVALNDSASSYIWDLINNLILNKMTTSSGLERSTWNAQAIQNFLDTFGFGVGNGSARASSFPLAVIASLGFPGAILYGTFLLSVLFARRATLTGYDDGICTAAQSAAKSACLAWLIAASVSGALIDLGLPFFAFSALACVLSQQSRQLWRRSPKRMNLPLINRETAPEKVYPFSS